MDNDNQEQLPQAISGRVKKQKKTKPTAEAFLRDWRADAIAEGDPVPHLRARLKTGYAGEVTEEHLGEMFSSLSGRPLILERLVLPLAAQERFGRQKTLSRRLLSKARLVFEQAIHYDRSEFATYRGPKNIEEWVKEHAPVTPAAERDAWFRRFVVCLLHDAEPKTLIRGLLSVSHRWLSSNGMNSGKEDAIFVRGIINSIAAPIIAAKRLEAMLSGVQVFEEQNRQILNRELDLERQVRSRQDEIDRLYRRVEELERHASIAANEDQKKSRQIEDLEKSLAEAGERYALLDQHWQGASEQELTKQSGSFRASVGREVEEAVLALDREEPNLGIALRRLRRIQEILSN